MKVTTQHNQTFLDIVLQHTGTVEVAFEVLEANPGMHLDSQPPAGTEIEIPEHAIKAGNALVKSFYVENYIVPSSAIELEAIDMELIGDDEGFIGDTEGYI